MHKHSALKFSTSKVVFHMREPWTQFYLIFFFVVATLDFILYIFKKKQKLTIIYAYFLNTETIYMYI